MFINIMRKFKVDLKIVFITTNGASKAKRQVLLTSEEENILLDLFEDPNVEITQDNDDDSENIVYIDDVLSLLELKESEIFTGQDSAEVLSE